MRRAGLLLACATPCVGHGSMSRPCTWLDPDCKYKDLQHGQRKAGCNGLKRAPGQIEFDNGCIPEWYTNQTFIPGDATIPWNSPLLTMRAPVSKDKDWTKKNPWRAPGSAPLYSPCGNDGGNPKGCGSKDCSANDPNGCDSIHCRAGGYAHGPDMRSLPGNTHPTEWAAGDVVEVAWALTANHGGGYQYRLCPLPKAGRMALTEECFQKTPLAFAGNTSWAQFPKGGTTHGVTYEKGQRVAFPAMRTSTGTSPAGSTWTKNPIPGCYSELFPITTTTPKCDETQFPPVIPGLQGFDPDAIPSTLMEHHIIDKVQIPADLTPGDWVISFRYDCEQFPQVWNQCGDVRITKGGPAPAPAPSAGKYACQTNACVTAASGVDKATCESACGVGH